MMQKTASTSVIALQLNLLRCAEYRLGPFCSHTALRAVRKIQYGGIRELAYGVHFHGVQISAEILSIRIELHLLS